MRNRDVVDRFVNRDFGYSANSVKSHEDGTLYSYSAKIAEWEDGEIVVYDGWDGYSPTTSKHFHHLHSALESADVEWTATHSPAGKGKMKSRWR